MFQIFHSMMKVGTLGPSRLASFSQILGGFILTMLQSFNAEKAFGFVISRNGGEEYVLLHVPPLI